MRSCVLLALAGCGLAQVPPSPGWTAVSTGTSSTLHSVVSLDRNVIIAAGDKGILRSADGGANWSTVAPGFLVALSFVDAKTGVAVGYGGLILRTEDGGITWKQQSSGSTAAICGVALRDAQSGIAVGSDVDCASIQKGHGQIFRTQDGGATWQSLATQYPDLRNVTFADSQTVIVVGDEGTGLRSENAGLTWTALHNADRLIGGLFGVSFFDASSGVAVGGGGLARTVDGGKNWSKISQPAPVFGPLFGLTFTDTYNGWSAGDSTMILRTMDGGLTWSSQPSGQTGMISIFFSDPLNGWATVSGGGLLLHTTTGGEPGPVAVSAASLGPRLAPDSLATLAGAQFAAASASADPRSPPTTLGGISVRIRDAAGGSRLAPLLYVSPTQINFEIPSDTPAGDAAVEIVNAPATMPPAKITLRAIAPSLFTGTGKQAAAYAVRLEPDGSKTVLPAGDPVTLDDRPVYLIVYGTGIRGRSSLDAVRAFIGGTPVQVTYAGPAGDGVPGLDQINLRLPAALKGGVLALTVDGVAANSARVEINPSTR